MFYKLLSLRLQKDVVTTTRKESKKDKKTVTEDSGKDYKI